MSNKNNSVLRKVLGVTVVVACFTVGIGLRQNKIESNGSKHISSNKNSKSLLIDSIKDISGCTQDQVYEKLGKAKEVYHSKVHSYVDPLGKYDILIDGKVKSVVVTVNDNYIMDEKAALAHLNLSSTEDAIRVKKENKDTIAIYNKANYKKIYIIKRKNSDLVETIKVEMK